MALVLDTTTLPPGDREEAFRSVLVDATAPSDVRFVTPGGDVAARVDVWSLGDVHLVRAESSNGLWLRRSEAQVRRGWVPVVSLAVQERLTGRQQQFGDRRLAPPGTLTCTDLTVPYEYWWGSGGAGCGLHLPVHLLGVPPDVVRRATAVLPRSPLYDLVSAHLVGLVREVPRITDPEVGRSVGRACLELARSLLLSAANAPEGTERRQPGAALVAQARAYMRQHLRDADLGPDAVAAALHVSPRQLYAVCAREGFSIEQWIIDRRLEAARAELADPAATGRTVAVIARGWGFRDPGHFTKRFRAAYGETPGSWRRLTSHRRDASGA